MILLTPKTTGPFASNSAPRMQGTAPRTPFALHCEKLNRHVHDAMVRSVYWHSVGRGHVAA